MKFEMMPAKELDAWIDRQDTFLIDLRAPQEYVRGHLKGAVNIPYERLKTCCMFPKDRILILYCDRGATSMAAARELADQGYRVRTVIGGILSYRGRNMESFL
ncbi:MAG: rhodanese-like domain-containing protein [Candidatus Limivivens sp.]|nr:rhodanese-like domain-containing protein [Candidatus Limivivens sp.]